MPGRPPACHRCRRCLTVEAETGRSGVDNSAALACSRSRRLVRRTSIFRPRRGPGGRIRAGPVHDLDDVRFPPAGPLGHVRREAGQPVRASRLAARSPRRQPQPAAAHQPGDRGLLDGPRHHRRTGSPLPMRPAPPGGLSSTTMRPRTISRGSPVTVPSPLSSATHRRAPAEQNRKVAAQLAPPEQVIGHRQYRDRVPDLRRAGEQRPPARERLQQPGRLRIPAAPLVPVARQPPHVRPHHRIDRARPPELPARPGRRPAPSRGTPQHPSRGSGHPGPRPPPRRPPRPCGAKKSGACRRGRPCPSASAARTAGRRSR